MSSKEISVKVPLTTPERCVYGNLKTSSSVLKGIIKSNRFIFRTYSFIKKNGAFAPAPIIIFKSTFSSLNFVFLISNESSLIAWPLPKG